MKTYRYYSLMRPIGPGTVPSPLRFEEVVNFNRRTYISCIRHEAWGYFETTAPLSLRACDDCEVVYFEDYPWTDMDAEGRAVRPRLNLLSDVRRWVVARDNLIACGGTAQDADEFISGLHALETFDDYFRQREITEDDYFDLCVELFDDFDWDEIRPTVRLRPRKEKKMHDLTGVNITVHCPLDDRGQKNLSTLLQVRGELIRKALTLPADAPLEFEIAGEDVTFAWEIDPENPPMITAAMDLLCGICGYAAAHRVSSKPARAENERYSFRVFLNRIGLGGPEHKETRAVLLRNLQGDSAYIHGRKA